jgi:hypothetical protein
VIAVSDAIPAPPRYAWSRLNGLQVGRYAEYFVKMEFTLLGFDVYASEVDDKGIDFVIRSDANRDFDVQVKSVRIGSGNYIFFPKATFDLRSNLFAAIVLFEEGQPPRPYLIPATAWLTRTKLLVSYDYSNRKSKPEWGLNLSRRNLVLLEPFAFESVAASLQVPGGTT